MPAARTHRHILDDLKRLSNPQIARHSARFFKTGKGEYGEGDVFLGIRIPLIRSKVREYGEVSFEETLKLLSSEYHEARIMAVLMLVARFQKADEEGRKKIYNSYLGNTEFINNWDIVDSSAHLITGPWLDGKSHAPLMKLAKSRNLWERRIAMMSTLHFIRKNQFETTFMIAELLLNDREDLIHKICGWMLREVGKRDQKAEEAFLLKHYRNMPRTMLRYAIEKFPAGERRAYLEGRK